jgi:hypothetical protein
MVRSGLWRLLCCFIYSLKRRDKEPNDKDQKSTNPDSPAGKQVSGQNFETVGKLFE